jgi:hypothetical protein
VVTFTHSIGNLVDPRDVVDVLEKRKGPSACWESNPGSSSLKSSHCIDCAVLASFIGVVFLMRLANEYLCVTVFSHS